MMFVKLQNSLLFTVKRNKIFRSVNTLSPLTSAFNSLPEVVNVPRVFQKRTGLFGVQELNSPSGFQIIQEKAVSESEVLIKECNSPERKRKIVEVFDELSNCLCKVADLAEFVRLTHPKSDYANKAEEACIAIGGLVEKLNTHRPLYDALKQVVENGDKLPTNEVDDHVAKLFLFDFEQSGIHLDDNDRKKIYALNEFILTLGQKFLHSTIDVRAAPKSKLPKDFKHPFIDDGENFIVNGMYSDSNSEIVRELAYKVYLHSEPEQEQCLSRLLGSRHEMAALCGFPSFAHRSTRGSLAETPELVVDFLTKLSVEAKPLVQSELEEMKQLKKKHCVSSLPLANWDVIYLTGMARNRYLSSSFNQDLSEYFSLGTVMEGLSKLFDDLFGVTFEVQEAAYGELWNKDVFKLAVLRDSSELLGYIYCDFFENKSKIHQDCHFTIRGGKRLQDGSYQDPVVVLYLNLPAPTLFTPSLLSLSQVENLFHEMGHAIHSMLARTTYQHVTGTRCSTDFAEIPSILMEFFANDSRVLSRIACHYKTEHKLPILHLDQVLAAKNTFAALEMQLQIFYSLLDQRYHGDVRWDSSRQSTSDILAEVQNDFYCFPHVPNTAWQLRFGHLVGYGSRYYAYLMSRAVASWIWQECFKENPFNRDAGRKFFDEVLKHGGGKPPKAMVSEFLGKEITSENLVSALLSDLEYRKSRLNKLKNMKRT